jgi:uncharacterized protein
MFFVVLGRDKPGMGAIRAKVRPAHRSYGKRKNLPARLLAGAPLTEDDGITMIGTMLVLEAPDREAVEAYLEKDPYVTADIFERLDICVLQDDPTEIRERLAADRP